MTGTKTRVESGTRIEKWRKIFRKARAMDGKKGEHDPWYLNCKILDMFSTGGQNSDEVQVQGGLLLLV